MTSHIDKLADGAYLTELSRGSDGRVRKITMVADVGPHLSECSIQTNPENKSLKELQDLARSEISRKLWAEYENLDGLDLRKVVDEAEVWSVGASSSIGHAVTIIALGYRGVASSTEPGPELVSQAREDLFTKLSSVWDALKP